MLSGALVRRSVTASAAAAGALFAAGCGSNTATPRQGAPTLTPEQAHGKALFVQSCSSCHTLADAATKGTVGKNLDTTQPTATVLKALAVPPKNMPANLVSGTTHARSRRMSPRSPAARRWAPNAAAGPLMPDELKTLDAYWRAANYLSVGQIYLLDNPLVRERLMPEHVKPRLLGHWGTTPGLNFVYVAPEPRDPRTGISTRST